MKRPNILLIVTDQQRWDALGANGNKEVKTPNLDRLVREGLSFDHYFVQNPVCMPSRVSFLTGQYPSKLGITHMAVPVPEDTITLPKLLRNYGYTTANIGKLHFLPHSNREHQMIHPDYGFDHLEISDEPGCYEDAYRAWVRRLAPDQLPHISLGLPPAASVWQQTMGLEDGFDHPPRHTRKANHFPGDSAYTHSAFVAEQTMEYVRSRGNQPFLCVSGFYSPHEPWTAPREFFDLYDPKDLTLPSFPADLDAKRHGEHFSDEELRAAKHGYYAMVSEVDHHVGRIIQCLEEQGILDDTIIVVTSDHGEWLGEHLRYGKGFPGHDCISRVPFVVRYPEVTAHPGQIVSALVEGIDLVPTLLECAGIPVPSHIQGSSLLPLLKGDLADKTTKEGVLMEGTGWKTLRTRRHRYVCMANGQEYLYDMVADPSGYRNVAEEASHTPTLTAMRYLLLKRLLEAERPMPRVWPY